MKVTARHCAFPHLDTTRKRHKNECPITKIELITVQFGISLRSYNNPVGGR